VITHKGHIAHVDLVLPIEWNRMPAWLEALLAPYTERFAMEWCPDHWAALQRLSGMTWRDQWGTDGGGVFVSEAISRQDQGAVFETARLLKCDEGLLIDRPTLYWHVLAPKGTLR
jgi:hypothetical protein